MKTLLLSSDEHSISTAIAVLKRGGVVAYPTDTVYGLGCDPFVPAAVERLVEAKQRDLKPIPVLCAGWEEACRLVELSPRGLELGRRYWPGGLTIVAPLCLSVPAALDQRSGWLGVRVPNDEIALSLARGCGGYITGTSANLSGQPSSQTAQEVEGYLAGRIDAILDGGPRRGTESTVVRVKGESVEVLRRGAVAFESGIRPER